MKSMNIVPLLREFQWNFKDAIFVSIRQMARSLTRNHISSLNECKTKNHLSPNCPNESRYDRLKLDL